MRTLVVLFVSLLVLVGVAAAQTPAPPAPGPAIETGSEVSVEYTLKDDSGSVLDSNKGRNPLTFTQGEHQIIPGLEKALSGMHAGEEKKVTVPPADGYGEVDPRAITEVPKDSVPAHAQVEGMQLVARSADGRTRLVRVKEVRDQTVLIDLNHPLAGKILHFDIRILRVEPPKK
jgi:FKBP-type peptidyl-prolyl cis-trans isomerase SlyD